MKFPTVHVAVFSKDPHAVVSRTIDWSDWLADGETISTSTWILPSGVSETDSEIVSPYTTIYLSGGTEGQNYTITNRITTSGGRTEDRSIQERIRAR